MSAAVGLREGTRADREAILDLRRLVFPGVDPEKQQADFWDWEFAGGYAGPGRCFVAEADGKLAGHFAFVPQRYELGAGRTITGALAVDVMVHPHYRRQGVFSRLARYAAEQGGKDFPVITAYQIRPEVLGGMRAGGWEPSMPLPVLVKPLSWWRAARDVLGWAGEGDVRSVPAGEIPLAGVDDLLRSPLPRQKRTPEFLEWRYRRNPHWRYGMEGDRDGGELRTFVVYRRAVLRGRPSLAITDAGCAPGEEERLQQLVRRICREHGRGLGLAAAMISGQHPAFPVLRRSGFIPGPHRFRLLVQVFDRSLRRLVDQPWSLSWGDTDHL